jgi:hypothetical protein
MIRLSLLMSLMIGLACGCGEEVPTGDSDATPDSSRNRRDTRLQDDAGGFDTPGGFDLSADSVGGLTLSLSPDRAQLLIEEGEPLPTVDFDLFAIDGARSTQVRDRDVEWLVDHPNIGTIDRDGIFTVTDAGGRTTVRALYGGSQASAPVTVGADEVIVVAGADGLPNLFEAADIAAGTPGPAMAYPSDQTLFPRNIAPVLFQWEGSSPGRYRLRLSSGGALLTVYTTDWNWQAAVDVWQALANSSAGLDVTVQAARLNADNDVELGPEITIEFSGAEVGGAVYYWAPSAVSSGIVRLPVGATSPEPFLVGSVFNCVGCHALSPDGSRLAYTRSAGGTPIGSLGVIGTDEARTVYVNESIDGYYPTFAPDNVRLAVARGGNIVIVSSDTGRDETVLRAPDNLGASYPAWSPRGDIAFSAGTSPAGREIPGMGDMGGLGISEAGIARVRADGEAWSSPEWLVRRGDAGGGDENLFYPSYSPDGLWLAFNRAEAAVMAGGSPDGSQVWIVDSEGEQPIHLELGSGGASVTNSWPKWAPATQDGRLWIAFTSSRPYGRMSTEGGQIWITGITPSEAVDGSDPSAAAFWMPFQSMANSNHVAYWAEYEKGEE